MLPPKALMERILDVEHSQTLVQGIQQQLWSVEQLVVCFCWRALEVDKTLQVISELMFEEALQKAIELDEKFCETRKLVGPLHGVPIFLSDEVNIAGVDSTLGCPCQAFQPVSVDSLLVQQLKTLGAIPICKTAVPWHLIFSDTSSPLVGSTRHKDIPHLSLGGRGGALAQLISSGVGLVGLGTDAVGGLRHAANHSGLFALKPTQGRVCSIQLPSTWDLLPSVSSPITKNLDELIHFTEILLNNNQIDPTAIPIPYDYRKMSDTLFSRRLTIGYYTDDDIMRANPTVKRAVMMAVQVLERQGHQLVPFKIPDSHRPVTLISKLYNPEKMQKPCMKASLTDSTSKLSPIFPMLFFMNTPKMIWNGIGYLFSRVLDDSLVGNLFHDLGGPSTWFYPKRKETDILQNNQEKNDFAQLFAQEWDLQGLDAMICPVHACPPAPTSSSSLIWPGTFYSTLYSLLDYPVGVFPNVTQVERTDFVNNVINYAHNAQFQWRQHVRGRQFKFLGVMGLEEINHSISDRTILGVPVGVQVVGKRFQEEKVLAVMKLIERGLALYPEARGMNE